MKVKFKFNRRYSMVITLLACASSLWLIMTRFHFPAEEVLNIAFICLVLVVPLILFAAIVAFVSRKIADRRMSFDDLIDHEASESEVSSPSQTATPNNNKENSHS